MLDALRIIPIFSEKSHPVKRVVFFRLKNALAAMQINIVTRPSILHVHGVFRLLAIWVAKAYKLRCALIFKGII